MKRALIAIALVGAALLAALVYGALQPSETAATAGSEIEVVDGLAITYLATPALFDALNIHPGRDFGVLANGNVVMSAREGVVELEVRNQELASAVLNPPPPLDSLAIDEQAVVLGIQGRYFGQLGSGGFQKAIPLPPGDLRLAASSRPGWVYLVRNESRRAGHLYGIWDNGTLSALAQFPAGIRAVADDERTTYVATERGLFAVDERRVRVIAGITPDMGPADALAARSGRLFVAANDRVYVLADGAMLAIVRGMRPQLLIVGDRLYCWDQGRKLLLFIDIAPLLAA